jgi:hypothetical protein
MPKLEKIDNDDVYEAQYRGGHVTRRLVIGRGIPLIGDVRVEIRSHTNDDEPDKVDVVMLLPLDDVPGVIESFQRIHDEILTGGP